MAHPNKIDKDAVHTTLAIAGLSAILVGVINIGLEELKYYLAKRRQNDKKEKAPPLYDDKNQTPPKAESTCT